MKLTNKDIAEGMRITRGKDTLKVISWDKRYSVCLLHYLDSERYVIAQNYELSGDERNPKIDWFNGRYFTADNDNEAFDVYLDYLGGANKYDISEKKTVTETKAYYYLTEIQDNINKLKEYNSARNVEFFCDGEDCYITVELKNRTIYEFDLDFGTQKFYYLTKAYETLEFDSVKEAFDYIWETIWETT